MKKAARPNRRRARAPEGGGAAPRAPEPCEAPALAVLPPAHTVEIHDPAEGITVLVHVTLPRRPA